MELPRVTGDAVCPGCGNSAVEDRGACRPPVGFSGLPDEERTLLESTATSHLFQCRACGLGFRFPVISDEHLQQLYAGLPSGRWQYRIDNTAWTLAQKWLYRRYSPHQPVRILDIGAFDGTFLKTLPAAWDRQAIEPAVEARRELVRAGIPWIADFLNEPPRNHSSAFDVVTMFDVFEHLPDPVQSLMHAVQYLKPGGHLLISTGNCEHWTWKWLGPDHWYCVTSQHMTFGSPHFFRQQSRKAGASLRSLRRHSHQPFVLREAIRQAFETATFTALRDRPWWSPFVKMLLKCPGLDYARHRSFAPYAPHLRDHLFVILQRVTENNSLNTHGS